MTDDPLEDQAVELDGVNYLLLGETSGDDFMFVQDHAIREVDVTITDEKSGDSATVKRWKPIPHLYSYANLYVRLQVNGERLPQEEVRKLPKTHYQTLAAIADELDNREAAKSQTFLATYLKQSPMFQSLFQTSGDSPQSGSESESNTDSKPERKTKRAE